MAHVMRTDRNNTIANKIQGLTPMSALVKRKEMMPPIHGSLANKK